MYLTITNKAIQPVPYPTCLSLGIPKCCPCLIKIVVGSLVVMDCLEVEKNFISRVLWLCKCLTYSSVLSKLRNSFDCVSVWFSLSVRVGDIGITISGGNCAEFGSTAFFNNKRQ